MIHPSAVVDGSIGRGTVVHAHAYIGPTAVIGDHCVIGPGAVIGADGFGYKQVYDGYWERKPQSHGVWVADDVHIGANTCVDRGSYRPTVIGRGTRIDNLVHIAHNAVIGEDCLIIAQAMIAGSVTLGDSVYVAPCAAIRDNVTVGERAFIGMGAVVVNAVEPREHVRGVPAKGFQPTAASRAYHPAGDHVASRR